MQTRNTLIMAAVLLVISAFVYFYEIRGREEREAAEKQEKLLLHFEPGDITGLSLTTADGTVSATKDDADWQITEPVEMPANSTAIESIVENVSKANHERLIVENAEDLAPFGLDEPVATLALDRAEGDPLKLAIGKDTPVGANVYATVGDTHNVYSALRPLRTDLTKTLFDLRDRSVLSFATDEIDRVEVTRGALRANVHRDGDGWTAEAPFAGSADTDTIDDLLDALESAEAKSFAADTAPDAALLGQYGLDAPTATITLRSGDDATYGLLVGAASTDPEGYYAMRDGGSSIFVVGSDLLNDVPDAAVDLRDKQVLNATRQRLADISIERPGRPTLRMTRQGTDWNIIEPRRVETDSAAISRLLGALTDMRAQQFAAAGGADTATVRIGLRDAGADDGPVESTTTLTVGAATSVVPLSAADDDEPEAVDVYPVSVVGDDTAFLVSADDLDDVLVDLFDVRNKTLVEFTQDDLTGIEVNGADGAVYTLTKSGETWTADKGTLGDSDVSDMLWDLNYLRMEAIAREWDGAAPNLAAYGLDAPRFHIVARDAEGVVADIRIGSEVPAQDDASTRVYGMVGDRPAVFEISASLADALAGLLDTLGS